MQIDTMRITAKQNKLLQKAFNMSKSQHFKLPRKPKKAFIKRYGRKAYNYLMLRQYLQYKQNENLSDKQKMMLHDLGTNLKPCTESFFEFTKQVKIAMRKLMGFNELMVKTLEQTMPDYNADIETNRDGFLITIEPA